MQHGIYNAAEKYQRLEEIPFKSETKTMSVKVKNKKVCTLCHSTVGLKCGQADRQTDRQIDRQTHADSQV